ERGLHRSVWCWNGSVASVAFDEGIHVRLADGREHSHSPGTDEWIVEMRDGASTTRVALGGAVDAERIEAYIEPEVEEVEPQALLPGTDYVFELDEPNYRRSEQTWHE